MPVRRPSHATAVAYLALFFALGGTATAATGGVLLLGKDNNAALPTRLTNTGAGSALELVAPNADTPSLTVSNDARVPQLNSDKLDGLDSAALQRRIDGSCGGGQAISAVAESGAVSCSSSARGAGEILLQHEEPGTFRRPAAVLGYTNAEETLLTKKVTLKQAGFLQVMGHGRTTMEDPPYCHDGEDGDTSGTRLGLVIDNARSAGSGDLPGLAFPGTYTGTAHITAWLPAGEHAIRVNYSPGHCYVGTTVTPGAVSMSELKLTAVVY